MCKHLPNIITLLRILLAISFIIAFLNSHFYLSLILFSLAAISDFLDGYLARKWNSSSKLGAILDPAADKFTIISSYFLFYLLNIIPAYLAIIVIARDLLILFTVGICFLGHVKLKFSPLFSSKINTTIQLIFIIIVITCKSFSINISLNILMWIVGFSTIYSGVDYLVKYRWIKNVLFK